MTHVVETKNYSVFELLDFNRNVEKVRFLEESMRRHGWIDAYPMHCVKNGSNKLKIKAGNHRFYVARSLNIPVKYVLCNDNATIHELEKATVPWSISDYLVSFCRQGKASYLKVKEYHEETGIGLSACISMLGGQSAGSGNMGDAFKDGTYQIRDTNHAGMVADIVLHLKKCGIKWATNNLLVRAISKIAWADGFDVATLKGKISMYPYLVEKRSSVEAYIEMLDMVYNRKSHNKIPLAFNADKAARERSPIHAA